MGLLSDLFSGIGKTVGNVGGAVVNMLGSGAASARDLGAMIAGNYDPDNSEDLKWKKFMTGADNAKDAYAKSAGQALNAATTLTDVALALGSGGASTALTHGLGAVATNSLQGAVSGFADELQENGGSATLEGAANRALVGGLSGAATAGLNNAINTRLANNSGKLMNGNGIISNTMNKAANSAAGRGAMSGAVGGAIGGGTMTALKGGDIGSIIENSVYGGGSGAVSGATVGAATSAISKAANKAIDKIWTSEQNRSFQQAISNPNSMKESVYLGEVSDEALGAIQNAYNKAGIDLNNDPDAISAIQVQNGKLYLTKEGAQHLNQRRIQNDGLTAKQVTGTMRNATGKNAVVSDSLTKSGNATMGAQNGDNKLDIAHVGVDNNGNLKLMTAYETNGGQIANQIKDALAGSQPASYQEEPGLASETSALQGDDTSISQNKTAVKGEEEPFTAYGESDLAKRTKKGFVAEKLSEFGDTLEGAQTNITRAQARRLGIESTGDVIESVRKKTGITDIDTQAALAKELTGGQDSLMDSVQRTALSATEDGSKRMVDTSSVIEQVETIVNKYADSNTFGSTTAKEKFITNLKRDIKNPDTDVITIANRMKSAAADLKGNGIVGASGKDAAQAKIYSEVAAKLDDLSYKAVPQENVDTMFEVTISEMKARATQAQNNGNKDIAKAYNKLADSLDAEPRTISAYRSFKKSFVDVAKINTFTSQAENGAAIKMGSSANSLVNSLVNTVAQGPVGAGLAKVGGGVNAIADKLSSGGTPSTPAQITPVQTNNVLNNAVGRTAGNVVANDANESIQEQQALANNLVQNSQLLQQLQQPQVYYQLPDGRQVTLEETSEAMDRAYAAGDIASYNELGQIYTALKGASDNGVAGAVNFSINSDSLKYENMLSQLQQAALLALQNGDAVAFNHLASIYNTASAMYKTQQEESKLTTSDRSKLQDLSNSLSTLDQLEQLYNSAGGGQGVVKGNLAKFFNGLSGGGNNADLTTYEAMKQSLGMAIVKNFVNLGATESDAARYAAMLPEATDTPAVAQQKLSQLRTLIKQAQQNVYASYS